MLAEEKTCHSVWFVTLTYGGGYENTEAYALNYADVQKCFKRLRKAGHRFKYIAVGEYGGKLNRAHFHLVMYWQTEPPEVVMDQRIQWDAWPHGFSQCEYPRSQQGCAVYIMDYLNKSNLKECVMKYSKNPMLGEEYLLEYARKHAATGLPLFAESDRFTIPDSNNKNGQPFYYPVGRESGMYSRMIDAYLLEWATLRPEQRIPLSEDVTQYLEDLVQETDDCPVPVQKYIAEHYGYYPTEDIPDVAETTYAMQNCNLIYRYPLARFEVFNNHMELIWQSPESVHVSPHDGNRISKKQRGELIALMLQQVPPRCLSYLKPLIAWASHYQPHTSASPDTLPSPEDLPRLLSGVLLRYRNKDRTLRKTAFNREMSSSSLPGQTSPP